MSSLSFRPTWATSDKNHPVAKGNLQTLPGKKMCLLPVSRCNPGKADVTACRCGETTKSGIAVTKSQPKVCD